MNFDLPEIGLSQNITIRNLLSENVKEDLINEIVTGLQSPYPYISSKFFYDDNGSALFEKITTLREYYPTRTEKAILTEYAAEILNYRKVENIIELGSGDSSKISILLDAIPSTDLSNYKYIPVDVSLAAISKSANELEDRFPDLKINGHVFDFTTHIKQLSNSKPALFCFFGSTIGNFNRPDAENFLGDISKTMTGEDVLMLGFDMIKDHKILNAAYNDSNGTTAEFNLNILNVLNSIIDSDFDSADFEHLAFFNDKEARIEMHLVANKDVIFSSPYLSDEILIRQGQKIHTENSYKFSIDIIKQLAEKSGLEIVNNYTDSHDWFSLVAMRKKVEAKYYR